MEVINLKSKKIKNYSYIAPAISINGNILSITSSAANQFNLKDGQFVHFINEGREWSFIANDDPDGFKLQKENREHRHGLRIFNAALCNLMRRSLQINGDAPARFYVHLTDKEYRGCKIIEILTAKQIDKIGQ